MFIIVEKWWWFIIRDYSEIKKDQESALRKILKDLNLSFEKCLEIGGLKTEGKKIMKKEKDGCFEDPPMYKFFLEYDFEEDWKREIILNLFLNSLSQVILNEI